MYMYMYNVYTVCTGVCVQYEHCTCMCLLDFGLFIQFQPYRATAVQEVKLRPVTCAYYTCT